jgi:hypothetical protein
MQRKLIYCRASLILPGRMAQENASNMSYVPAMGVPTIGPGKPPQCVGAVNFPSSLGATSK